MNQNSTVKDATSPGGLAFVYGMDSAVKDTAAKMKSPQGSKVDLRENMLRSMSNMKNPKM